MRMFLLFVGVIFLTSCSNVLDKPLSAEHLPDVKEKIEADKTYSPMKKKYLVRNISDQTGYALVAEAMKVNKKDIPTFRKQLDELSVSYDSLSIANVNARNNNKNLETFVSLNDAKVTPIDKYTGYLGMTLEFNNNFEKEVLYAIIEYKYVNKYDTEFFSEKAKLTDDVAEGFKGVVEIVTTEKYNEVADFMYNKVPVQASLKDREELGVDVANRKVEREFLMEGLQVSVLGVVFTDKTELMHVDLDWEYFEEENIASK